jgi:flagellar hook assembly protein FlgD
LRRSVALAAAFLLASLSIGVSAVAAATPSPGDAKVVIIVGATHGATAGYRADADVAYAEAIKYTSDVTKVYSPNATWSRVKAAVAGASIVIYMGHGNGWPSPYTYDPEYTTKDGFGLNATAGDGDYNNKYYGEPYVSKLDLAPGAIILLHHLCYASGNSEPGHAEPSLSVARQRADNYAAGFLRAGAAAVIADGHAGAETYLRALFTTHQTVESMWRTMPNQNGHVTSFASARTPGATIFQDPNKPTAGFYRSLAVGAAGITTDEVVTGGIGDTAIDPATLQVPGNADVRDQTPLFDDPEALYTARALPSGTRLRVVDGPFGGGDGSVSMVGVVGIDDPAISGFVATADLTARDSAAPVIRAMDAGGPFSPDGDGQLDTTTIRARFSESVRWSLDISDADRILFEASGIGSELAVVWDGTSAGSLVTDGAYRVRVSADDSWQNGPASAIRTVVIDTLGPTLTSLVPGAETIQWFSPNGDGVRDSVALTATVSEPAELTARVRDADGALVTKWTQNGGTEQGLVSWDGRDSSGDYAPDGDYTLSVTPRDLAGNAGPALTRPVQVVGALRSVATGRSRFFPQDLDRLARTSTLTFMLQRPMTVTWSIQDADGSPVATHLDGVALPAGPQTWTYDGRDSDGAMLPRGRYTSTVVATDGTLTATQSVAFVLDAFGLQPSDSSPGRGQTISLVINSPEILSRSPRLIIDQPGLARWKVGTTRTGRHTYKVTFRLKTGGGSGSVQFKVKGVDKYGGKQSTVVVYALH